MLRRLSHLVLAGCLILAAGFAAKKDHNDAFVAGAPDENKIAREVRHQLVGRGDPAGIEIGCRECSEAG